MKWSHLLTAASSVRINGLGTALAACAFVMSLLLGAGTAQAQTLERDGENATAIRGLELDGFVYDVEFCSQNTPANYDGDPSTYDFTTSEEARAAAEAVNAVLNTEGGVNTVGDPGCPGGPPSGPIFRVGFEDREETILEGFLFSTRASLSG